MTSVCDYQTGERLEGVASERLIAESRRIETGAVGAYRDETGVWHWCDESDARLERSVYVEA